MARRVPSPPPAQHEIFVGNLTEEIVTSARDVERLMAIGERTVSRPRAVFCSPAACSPWPCGLLNNWRHAAAQATAMSAAPTPTSAAAGPTPSFAWSATPHSLPIVRGAQAYALERTRKGGTARSRNRIPRSSKVVSAVLQHQRRRRRRRVAWTAPCAWHAWCGAAQCGARDLRASAHTHVRGRGQWPWSA